ncbi:carboxymuconolactone decarboxylase family protein [Acidobacteria bacterium AH-259-A15]|nr:carboxymuconolactone decarboxylase family protein [Acidobacteria bacterium AH-259-A15]
MNQDLPEFLQKVVERYPDIWGKYGELSQAISSAEGLDDRSQRLVKLGIAIGAGRQGAVHSHSRKCKKAGLSSAELHHAALLAITTIGWSGAIAALSWINDELQDL